MEEEEDEEEEEEVVEAEGCEGEGGVALLAASAARFWARRMLRSGNFLIMACAVLCSSSRAFVHMYL